MTPPPNSPPSAEVKTPRTDARKFAILSDLQSGKRIVVDAEVAEDLERELLTAQAEIRELRKIVETEPELDDEMPSEMFDFCKTKEGATLVYRSVVKATKSNILKRIDAAITNSTKERGE